MLSKLFFGATTLLLVCVFGVPSVYAQSLCVTLHNDLRLEARDSFTGGDVTRLQRFLAQQGEAIYPERTVDGFYGFTTRDAVYRWQKAHGVKISDTKNWGYVDAKTRAAMAVCKRVVISKPVRVSRVSAGNPSYVTTPGGCPVLSRTLARGDRGQDVAALQQFLISKNMLSSDSATGLFGTLTEMALGSWQVSSGLVSASDGVNSGVGIAGPKTRARISQSCAPAMAKGESAPSVSGSPVTCVSKPAVCEAGFKPGGQCNLLCVLDDAPPPAWVAQLLGSDPVSPSPQGAAAPVQLSTPSEPASATPPSSPLQHVDAATLSVTPTLDAPYTATFAGDYNTVGECTGGYFVVFYGDGSSDRLPDTCVKTSYTRTHTYNEAGMYDAYITRVVPSDSAEYYDTQAELLVTVDASGGIQVESSEPAFGVAHDPLRNLASALVALRSVIDQMARLAW